MKKYMIFAWAPIAFWSASYMMTKYALPGFTPLSIAVLRLLIASLTLGILLLLKKQKLPGIRTVLRIIPSGIMGFLCYQICFNLGNSRLTTGAMSVLVSTSPIFTALFGRIFLKEKLTAAKAAAVAVGFIGVAVMFCMSLRMSGIGVLYGLLAALSLSGYYVYQRSASNLCDPLTATFIAILTAAVFMLFRLPTALTELTAAPASAVIAVVLLGITCSALSYYLWNIALSKADNALSVTNLKFAEPFIAALLGRFILDEKMTAAALTGGAIIVAGLILFYFGGNFIRTPKSRP